MTKRLFYTDSFLFSCEAEVLECRKTDKGFEIRLSQTVFFPEGGGQPGDSGTINSAEILDTYEIDGEIWHLAKCEIPLGTCTCQVNEKIRFSRMQCHSGEHIVSGIIHRFFGFDNVGFHLSDNDVTIDINGILTEEDIRKVEFEANKAVMQDFEVKTFFPTKEEAKNIPYRSKLDIEENLRLVEYEGYDICACCAPHVKRSGQIGLIKLLDFANYKGGVRIHMLCGIRALEDYQQKYASVLRISNQLSAKQNEISEAVERLHEECEKEKHEASMLRRILAQHMASSAKETDKNLVFFSPILDASSLRHLINSAIDKCNGICAAFSGTDGAYTFCMASKNIDLKAKSKEICAALGGRGGGSKEMICGSVSASQAEIKKYFEII